MKSGIKHYILFLFLYLFALAPSHSQGIKGTVKNLNGNPVAYTTVYIQELHRGTTANENGYYKLNLDPGEYDVRFQYLGYKTRIHKVKVKDEFVPLDVIIEEQVFELPAVTVTASGEDPAYYVMRKAVSLSQYYLNQVSEYKCRVYLKGSGVFTNIPAIMRRQLEQGGMEQDKHFVTETISEIEYQMPNNVQTRVISTRSSGEESQANPMSFITMNLYQDIDGIISPLSRSAFQVYRFQLEGLFIENGQVINKIKVIPRREGPDLYSGYIYIQEDTWNIHSADLSVEQSLFSVEIRQVYNDVGKGVWMAVSHDFYIKAKVMGFEMEYKYVASVSDYEISLNPNIDHTFYLALMGQEQDLTILQSKEAELVQDRKRLHIREDEKQTLELSKTPRQEKIAELIAQNNLKNSQARRLNRLISREARAAQPRESLEISGHSIELDDSARVRTAVYWAENRRVPLTPEEMESFEETPEDTVENKNTQRKLHRDILWGGSIKLSDNWRLYHNGISGITSYDYNTVDGLLYIKRINLTNNMTRDRRLNISNRTSYAFARNSINTDFQLSHFYDAFRRSTIGLRGGIVTSDYNYGSGINNIVNIFSTLFLRQNFLKLYEKQYIKTTHRTDIVNGLVLYTGLEYAQRQPLQNNSDFYIINMFGQDFTPNIPPVIGLENEIMPTHNAFIIDARLSYTHRHYYRRIGDRKQMMHSKYPTLSIYYKEGLKGIADSDTRFRKIEASINQTISVRLVGDFDYKIHAGKFFNNDNLFLPDYKHFGGNETWVIPEVGMNSFRTLGFYEYSTGDKYAYGHFQYSHARILLKRLPLVSKTLVREKLFFNILTTPGQKPYMEIGYGINQLFLMFNFEVITGFSGSNHHYTGFRIGIPLSGSATIRI